MLGRLFRRVTIQTLDSVVERGKDSERAPLRFAAAALDQARSVVGLDVVEREAALPAWSGGHPERPMWKSDQAKLRKFQLEKGIIKDGSSDAEEQADDGEAAPNVQSEAMPIKVFFKRGCPYARAAFDLLRERDIAFEDVDIKGDDSTLSWLKIVTGSKTTPQIFIRGEAIGGYDELRAMDLSGELRERVDAPGDELAQAELEAKLAQAEADAAQARVDAARQKLDAAKADGGARKPKKVSLNVVGKERSPFEDLLDIGGAATDETLEGDALIERVKEVLDECRPMVQADGGDIELLDVQNDVVHLQLTGNCVGCPSAQATLRQGIERRLKTRIPQISGIASPQLQG